MSARLVSAVFSSSLPAWLKPYATACANFAADDGSSVYPSIARLALMVGRCERATQTAIGELRRRKILTLEAPPGRHRATRYVFHAEALPRLSDGDQISLFHSYPQTLTGSPLHPMGAAHCTRSVIDQSFTNLQKNRARERRQRRMPEREKAS